MGEEGLKGTAFPRIIPEENFDVNVENGVFYFFNNREILISNCKADLKIFWQNCEKFIKKFWNFYERNFENLMKQFWKFNEKILKI